MKNYSRTRRITIKNGRGGSVKLSLSLNHVKDYINNSNLWKLKINTKGLFFDKTFKNFYEIKNTKNKICTYNKNTLLLKEEGLKSFFFYFQGEYGSKYRNINGFYIDPSVVFNDIIK